MIVGIGVWVYYIASQSANLTETHHVSFQAPVLHVDAWSAVGKTMVLVCSLNHYGLLDLKGTLIYP